MGGKHQMKHLIPIMVLLLLVSTSFVVASNKIVTEPQIILESNNPAGDFPVSMSSIQEIATGPNRLGICDHAEIGANKIFDGLMDEVRLSYVVRNSGWIKASFHTENNTDGFIITGANPSGYTNTNPENTEINPSNNERTVYVPPTNFSVFVSDIDGHDMNITFRTNESGSWKDAQINSSVSDGTYRLINKSWVDEYDKKYYYSINTSDGHGGWDNDTIIFFTMSENTIDPDGIHEYLNKPSAIHYQNIRNRTYFTYVDTQGRILIRYYDHDTGTFSDERALDDQDVDDHHSPTLIINETGYIFVFYIDDQDGHKGPIMMRVSSTPEQIANFESEVTVDSGDHTYPKPFINSTNGMWLTYRDSAPTPDTTLISHSEDWGQSWSATTFLDEASYMQQYQEKDDPDYIHVTCTDGMTADSRTNIYYCYSDDGGNTWKNSSDDTLSLPISLNEMTVAWTADNVRQLDVYSNNTHQAHILANRDINNSNETIPTYHIMYDGASWNDEKLPFYMNIIRRPGEVNAYTNGACIDRKDPTVIYAAIKNNSGVNYSDVVQLNKYEGTWNFVNNITHNGLGMKIRPMPIENYTDNMSFTYANGTYVEFDEFDTTLYYGMKSLSSMKDTLNVWINVNPETIGGTLTKREYPSMVYDSSADRTIMFGGDTGVSVNDTWVYNYSDNKWYNMSPGVSPTARYGHKMVYDSDADRTIMFGGLDSSGLCNDTWSYDFSANTWYNMNPETIGGTLYERIHHAMVYDSSAKRTMMYGGISGPSINGLNDTWVYNYSDNKWYKLDPETVGGRLNRTYAHAMAYDSSADRTIMFGGVHEGGVGWIDETWLYNFSDNTWCKINPETIGGMLLGRVLHVMTYDSDAKRTILFGGQDENYDQLKDTWMYNFTDNKWCKACHSEVGGTLFAREVPAMAYDSKSKKTILFAGFCNDFSGGYLNDTWMFKYNISNKPPNPPTNPDPANGSFNVEIDTNLSWYCWDPDLDDLNYDVYFEANDSTPDVKVSSNQTETTYNPGTMSVSTQYYWQIIAWDIGGASTEGPIWSFNTITNDPPDIPNDPEPEDGATDVDINAYLSWECSDPDEDDITYDVYFEENDPTPDVLVSNNQSDTTYDPGEMEYDTHHYWKIVAWDPYQYTEGPIWDFTTGSDPNTPPYIPSNPDPANGSTDIDADADLSWNGGDPDDDSVVYTVYFEANEPSPNDKVADNISETTFDPGTMNYETVYYWRIIAKDSHGASTWGPVWHFTTTAPDLDCDGSLSWNNVKPRETVEGSFTVRNIGGPGTLLDWEVTEYPEWGTWNLSPLFGDDLKPTDGIITITALVKAPDEKNSEFIGEIKIVNSGNSADYCTVDIVLKTSKSKSFIFNSPNQNWWLDRFPLLQRLLEVLIK